MLKRFVLVAWLWALVGSVAQAQTSELYLGGIENEVIVVQNGAVVRSFSLSLIPGDGPGLVVNGTIKTIGGFPGACGREYDLVGNRLGGREYCNPSYQSLNDGATDGVHNWSIAANDFPINYAVVEGDSDWGGLTVLFEPQRRSSGITYDPSTGNFWVTNVTNGSIDRVQEYTRDGTLVSEFDAFHPDSGYAIALDPADDTLWITSSFANSGKLFQYDKLGNLLATVDVPGLLFRSPIAAEFDFARFGLRLDLEGTCPGNSTADISGATANGTVAVLAAMGAGNFVVPGGVPCAGTELGLSSAGLRVVAIVTADADGNVNLGANLPPVACGGAVQALDVATCNTSNVETIN